MPQGGKAFNVAFQTVGTAPHRTRRCCLRAATRRTQLWGRATAALLLSRLIETHKQELEEGLSSTLSARLTELLAKMTGQSWRQVFLTRQLYCRRPREK